MRKLRPTPVLESRSLRTVSLRVGGWVGRATACVGVILIRSASMAQIVNNPNTLGGSPTTLLEYTGNAGILRAELRVVRVSGLFWFWTRVRVIRASNHFPSPTLTINGITVGRGWQSGNNQVPGSTWTTQAVGLTGSRFAGRYGFGTGGFDAPASVAFDLRFIS